MCSINTNLKNGSDNMDEMKHTHTQNREYIHEQDCSHTHEHEHTHEQEYVHTHEHDGHAHEQVHSHTHEHGHTHSHAYTKSVLNRLSRAIGHLEFIKRMVESGRDCSEVLVQLAAVRSAINNTGKVILKDHMEHCIVDAIESGDLEAIKEFEKAIDQFIK